jgi:hypothetical protein
MASRILTIVSCTLYFVFLVILTAIGVTSIIIAFVGLGLYIPTLINYNTYSSNICYVIDHEYDTCHLTNSICYTVMWSVEYRITNQTFERYIFSTITETYNTPVVALNKLQIYEDGDNYTCYYNTINVLNVKWDKPTSPKPYLIMMIIGFTLTGIYFIVIILITIYRCTRI